MSWDDDHCPVTEMLRSTCVHCRPAAERRRLDAFEADLTKPTGARTREIAPDRGFEDGPVIAAKFAGRCPAGRDPIAVGEHIRLHNGRYCHVMCVS